MQTCPLVSITLYFLEAVLLSVRTLARDASTQQTFLNDKYLILDNCGDNRCLEVLSARFSGVF